MFMVNNSWTRAIRKKLTVMKKLFLIRHAKSSWDNSQIQDHERILNPRGLQDAPNMGKKLKALYPSPEKIISSTACRAQETIALIKAQWCPLQGVEYDKLLYEGSVSTILDKIQTFPTTISSVALVFHNPTITHLANLLGSSSIPSIPTCGVVILSCKHEKWNFLEVGSCEIENFECPKKS